MNTDCVSFEPFALQVLDDAMAPEFPAVTVVVVDPGEPVLDGSVVLLEFEGEVLLRRARPGPPSGECAPARFVAADGPESARGSDWRCSVRGVVTGSRAPR